MKKSYLILALIIGICSTTFGQDINSYKYVIVPEKFNFLNEANDYQMNKLTKFLFDKFGFTAVMEREIKPADLSLDPCNTLYADVLENNGFMQTKLQVVLKDCRNQVVFTSEEGKSSEKEFKKAYQEALRDAFQYVKALSYKYQAIAESVKAKVDKVPSNSISNVVKEKEQEKENAEVIVTAIPQDLPKKTDAVSKEITKIKTKFTSGNLEFYLLKTDFGFHLLQSQMEVPFAKLMTTKSEGHFIYSTLQNSGIAYFDAFGNLNVEILTENGNTTSIKTYKLKD